jgi:hypothetical protein
MSGLTQKHSGAYYTPDAVVQSLLRWAVRDPADRLLDPACGDGRFIAGHRNSVGIEQDAAAAAAAIARAPWALVHEGDFFAWAAATTERFDCAAGNPPFIRYQTFSGATRERALTLCRALGAAFSGLTSSWAPFLVATASLLRPGGRLSFVVPAEIGHAPYAGPLLDYLIAHFATVHVTAVRAKLFPDLSEDCWLLHAEGFGGRTDTIRLTIAERFTASARPPRATHRLSVSEWRLWNRRLRPFLIPQAVRELYQHSCAQPGSTRFGDAATIGIGYVSGANSFFHLRPSEAERWAIPERFIHPSVRNGRALPPGCLTPDVVAGWRRADQPILLLRLPKQDDLPRAVRRYLATEEAKAAREAYKCRKRDPWYAVPDVQVPDLFLSYMSGRAPHLVRNGAGATCTNSVHGVRVRNPAAMPNIVASWQTPFVRLSTELEGHPLGGGMLKLEPREASQILFPADPLLPALNGPAVAEAVATLRNWRHYAV